MTSRTILITGVARGLGRTMAEGMARRGHQILGCGRSQQSLASVRKALGSGHDLMSVDVTDGAAVAAWAAAISERYGAPDLILNNAGVINERAPLWQIASTDFDRVIDVNIKGTANVIRAFVPAMIERGHGVVINFSSGWGQETAPDVAPYCASKYAIEGLTGAFSQELPEGIGAIALSPGIIHTEMLDAAFGAEANSFPTPKTWARDAVPYILSLGPEHNGQSLRVPGY